MVRLYFSEVDDIKAGQRLCNVFLQGKPVLKDFDIVKDAGGINRCVVKEFRNILVKDDLKVGLKPAADNQAGSVLCGIEIIAED